MPPRTDTEAWAARNQQLSELWNALTPDEKDIFRDPFFFACAGLPNLALTQPELEDDNDDNEEDPFGFQHLEANITAPKVHVLSEAEKAKYQPLFDRLVDVEKLHLSHGQPDQTQSIGTLQKKSLAELRKAHHDVGISLSYISYLLYLCFLNPH